MQYLIYLKLGSFRYLRLNHNMTRYLDPCNGNFIPLFYNHLIASSLSHGTVTMLLEIAWLIFGVVWLMEFYLSCPTEEAKEIMFGK